MADIQLENISRRFADGTVAVNQLNLEIKDGEFMIIVGPSGCGKSTVLRMIVGLEDITEGTIGIDDQEVTTKAPRDRNLAMVFQDYALYPHLTVRENMEFPLKLRKTPKEERNERIERAAKTLELGRSPGPQAGPALRRPAPAGCDGPGDRARPGRIPARRAALQPRRQAAAASARRARRPPAPASAPRWSTSPTTRWRR